MPPSDRDLVEQVKAAVDIVEVAQSYFPLKQKGERYEALCPFHREKTPSFSVHRTRQIFRCFGCGKSGDVLTLVMELERLQFPEALAKLAASAGISIAEKRRPGPGAGRRRRLLDLVSQAAGIYRDFLASAAGAQARGYLEERSLSPDTQTRFGIGYAPAEWRALHAELVRRGFSEDELLAAGLLRKNENGNRWDLMRNRVIIPIRDAQGRTIAFGGRVLDDAVPKYLNTPETELFSKKTVLFGFDRARGPAALKKYFLVVEGYMDVIATHQHGIENVVATLGTALTREHVSQLRRYAGRVILLFDADEGGQRAADRGATLLLQEGLDVAITTLPEGLDPDDFLRQHDAADFERYLIDNKEDLIDYLIRRARQQAGPEGSVTATAKAAREVMRVVDQIDDAVHFDLYVRKISQSFGVEERLLRRESTRARPARGARGSEEFRPLSGRRGMLRAWELDEILVIQAVTTETTVANRLVEALSEPDFEDDGRRRAFAAIRELVAGSNSPIPSLVLEKLKDDAAAVAAFEAALAREVPPGETLDAAIERMIERRQDLEYRRLREEVSRSGLLRSGDDEDLDRRLAEIARYHAARCARSKDANREQENGGAP